MYLFFGGTLFVKQPQNVHTFTFIRMVDTLKKKKKLSSTSADVCDLSMTLVVLV